MGQQVTYPIPECWEEEKGLSQEDRRKRFHCKPDEVIKIEDIALWDTTADETLQKAVEGKVTDAREDEKAQRKKKLKEEKQPPKKESSTTTKKGGAANGPRKKEEPPALCLQKNFKYYKNYSHDAALNAKVALIRCDITKMEVEAIVNAANKSLLGGGGIDGAIHRAAGQKLLEECKTLNGGLTGETKITRGYDLPAEYILHTVGPIIMSSVNKREEKELESCYITCLQLCVGYGIKSVAFCGISSGIYGYPLYLASHMALHAVRSWLQRNKNKVDLVVFCTFLPKELKCYEELMPIYFPPPGKCSKDVVAMLEESYKSYDPAEESDILDKEVADELEEERRKEEEERERMRERMKKRQEEEEAKKKKEKEKKKKKGESDGTEDSTGGDSSDAGEKEKEQDEKKAEKQDSDQSSSED